jgi:hypothetical protein
VIRGGLAAPRDRPLTLDDPKLLGPSSPRFVANAVIRTIGDPASPATPDVAPKALTIGPGPK